MFHSLSLCNADSKTMSFWSKTSGCLVLAAIFLQLFISGVKCQGSTKCSLNSSALGTCPAPGPDDQTECLSTCQADSGCEEGEKCCPTACGATQCTCSVPVTSCVNVVCPQGQVCRLVPQQGLNISAPQCFEPPLPKPGSCPWVFGGIPGSLGQAGPRPPCFRDCARDTDCPGRQKCCDVGCNSMCQLPGSSSCPLRERPPTGPCGPRCSGDAERCPVGWACCPTACGASCVPPTLEGTSRDQSSVPALASIPRSLTCASVDCRKGFVCIDSPNGPECVRKGVAKNNTNPVPKCKPPCLKGQQCQLVHVACITQPCPKLTRCVFPQTDPCQEPLKIGPCLAAISRYYYNAATQQCENFFWGGCDPNGNNFATEAECEQKCEGVCNQPKKVGPCKAAINRYYYNTLTQQCELFSWGGCQPNDNNFLTEKDCERRCEGACVYKGLLYENGQSFVDREDPCLQCQCQAGTVHCYRIPCLWPQCQNPVVPPGACCPVCDSADDDAAASAVGNVSIVCPLLRCKVCETGNFPDENGCQTCKCKPNASVCREPLKIGPCKALIYRYFYNATTGQCQRFGWGGCSPNGNNFNTERECRAVCEKGVCYHNGRWRAEGDFTDGDRPCELCRCHRDRTVGCVTMTCPAPLCDSPVTVGGQCCPRCPPKGKTCFYNGQWYPEGPVTPSNPCEVFCTCVQGGRVICASAQCAFPECSVPLVTPPGQCCPVCPPKGGVCFFNGRWYPMGRFDDPDNPCVHCECNMDRSIACLLDNCFILPCNNSVTLPGQCCPVCPPEGAVCFYKDQWHPEGPFTDPDSPCTQCTCDRSSGHVTCAAVNCPPANCPKPVQDPAECCRKCPGPGEVCYYRGRFHPVSDFQDWNFPCEHCRCHSNGTVRCVIQDCARPPCQDPVRVPGVCCPQCPPDGLSCFYDGQWYPAGDFRLPDNPCAFCQCDGSTGQASCAFRKCPRPGCDNPITVPEECCPLCPGTDAE